MDYKIQISITAEQDLEKILSSTDSILSQTDNIQALLFTLENALLSLAHLPERFATVDVEDLALYGIRKMIVEGFIIFYKIKQDTVFIVRILIMKRSWLQVL